MKSTLLFCAATLILHFSSINYVNTYNDQENLLSNTTCTVSLKRDYEAGEYYEISPTSNSTLIPNSFYFEKLNGYHGLNDSGICMIISTQIILGYYDSFINDSIVDEQYDKDTYEYISPMSVNDFSQSPGTGKKNVPDIDQRFRDYLINEATIVNNRSPISNGMTNSEQIALIQSYLGNLNLSYSLNYCEGSFFQDLNGFAKTVIRDSIDAGRPLIANSATHSMVAYGYDDTFVYVHTGYGYVRATPWSTFEASLPGFSSIGAVDISFNCSHLHSDNYCSSLTGLSYCPCGHVSEKSVFYPQDFCYEAQYYFYGRNKSITSGSYSIDTYRLRSGYIENEFINLSPRRNNAGLAFIEFYSSSYVRSIVLDVSFWSSNEIYNSTNHSHYIKIQVLDQYGDWSTMIDLLRDVNLSTNRYNQDTISVYFPSSITDFRIIASNDATGDRNLGRVSIGKLLINHE